MSFTSNTPRSSLSNSSPSNSSPKNFKRTFHSTTSRPPLHQHSFLSQSKPMPQTQLLQKSKSNVEQLVSSNTPTPPSSSQLSKQSSYESTRSWKSSRPNTNIVRKYETRDLIIDGDVVYYATIDALVDYVCDTSRCDTNMRDTFIYTFSCVCDQNIILQKLYDKYMDNCNNENITKPIIYIVTKWVTLMWNDDNDKTTSLLHSFIKILINQDNVVDAQKIRDGIERKVHIKPTQEDMGVGESLYKKSLDFLSIDARQLALQMTLIESELFYQIKPAELYSWNKKDRDITSPNVFKFVQHFNSMNWVFVSLLLDAIDVSSRVSVARHILHIANEFLSLNNFDGVMQIVGAFNCAAIHRLKVTKSFLGNEANNILNEIEKLTSSQKNFKAFRQKHNEATNSGIPYLGMFLTDMFFTDDMSSSKISAFKSMQNKTETTLVNVDKCRKLGNVIRDVIRFQHTPYHIKKSNRIYSFITELITNAPISEQKQFERSQEIESRDFIKQCTNLTLPHVYDLEHTPRYTILRVSSMDEDKKTIQSDEVVVWLLLPPSDTCYNYPVRVVVNPNVLIRDIIKDTRSTNYQFVLAPTKLLQVGVHLSDQITVGEALIQTTDYRNDPHDFFAIFSNHDAISLLYLSKRGSPQFMLKFKTIVDPTKPLAHCIPSLVHLFQTETDEFAFLLLDKSNKPHVWVNPFAKASICCDVSRLVVFPVIFIGVQKQTILKRCTPHPLNDTIIYVMSCMGLSTKKLTTHSAFNEYKVILSDGFLFLFKDKKKPVKVLNLGYYQLRLLVNPKTRKPTILLTKAIKISSNIDVPTYAILTENTQDTLQWFNTFADICISNADKRMIGVDIDNVNGMYYEELLDKLYLSPSLTNATDLFDISKISSFSIASDYEDTSNVHSFSIAELSQILIIALTFIPTPFITTQTLGVIHTGSIQFGSIIKERIAIGICRVLTKWSNGKRNAIDGIIRILANAFFGNEHLINEASAAIPVIAKKPIPDENICFCQVKQTEEVSLLKDVDKEMFMDVVSEILVELSGIRTIENGQIGSKKVMSKYMKTISKQTTRETMNFDVNGIPTNLVRLVIYNNKDDDWGDDKDDLLNDDKDDIVDDDKDISHIPNDEVQAFCAENDFVTHFQQVDKATMNNFYHFKQSLVTFQPQEKQKYNFQQQSTKFIRTTEESNEQQTFLKQLLHKRSYCIEFP
ncbi:Guanine nucleotide exchange factor [Entamoeba marina]